MLFFILGTKECWADNSGATASQVSWLYSAWADSTPLELTLLRMNQLCCAAYSVMAKSLIYCAKNYPKKFTYGTKVVYKREAKYVVNYILLVNVIFDYCNKFIHIVIVCYHFVNVIVTNSFTMNVITLLMLCAVI